MAVLVAREARPEGGYVARITIDNEAKLNTINRALAVEIVETIKQFEDDSALRLVILTGAGERAFVGGADLNELAHLDQNSAAEFITLIHRSCDGFRRLAVPVIARIDGFALGAGLELAAACDLRVASERSMFGMPEILVGIPSVVEAALLPALIGSGRARRLLLTGETIGASEALDWGLIDAVAPPDKLDARSRTLRGRDPGRRPARDPPAETADPRLGGYVGERADRAGHRRLCRGISHRRAAPHGDRAPCRNAGAPLAARDALTGTTMPRKPKGGAALPGFPIRKPPRRIITDTANGCASA